MQKRSMSSEHKERGLPKVLIIKKSQMFDNFSVNKTFDTVKNCISRRKNEPVSVPCICIISLAIEQSMIISLCLQSNIHNACRAYLVWTTYFYH